MLKIIVTNENNELTMQREQMDHQKQKLETEVNEQRTLVECHRYPSFFYLSRGTIQKSEIQSENLQLAAAKRSMENDLQLTKVNNQPTKSNFIPYHPIHNYRASSTRVWVSELRELVRQIQYFSHCQEYSSVYYSLIHLLPKNRS